MTKHGDRMDGRTRWRDHGRPEASLVGAQYIDWNHDVYPNKPYRLINTAGAQWLFRGTGLRDGSTFGVYGIEVDAVAPASPRGTKVEAAARLGAAGIVTLKRMAVPATLQLLRRAISLSSG